MFNAAHYETAEQAAFAQALFETAGVVEVNGRRFATTFSADRVLGRRDELLRVAATRRAA